jgi:translation initiation factor IF-1
MSKDDKIQIDGTIIASLPGGFFQVQLPEEFGGG